MRASFERPYTFTEACQLADLVVEVIITEWLGELDEYGIGETTYFRAKVLQVYHDSWGLASDEFVILQEGNSQWTYRGYPLFRNGERMLLSLKELDEDLDRFFFMEGEDCFRIVGAQMTELLVVEKDGREYAMKRTPGYNFTDIEKFRERGTASIFNEALKNDHALSRSWSEDECVYELDTLTDLIEDTGRSNRNE